MFAIAQAVLHQAAPNEHISYVHNAGHALRCFRGNRGCTGRGRSQCFFCAPALKIAQRGALPKVRISGHHFSRLTRNASQQVQTKALSTIMEEGSKEERERAKTVQDDGKGNR